MGNDQGGVNPVTPGGTPNSGLGAPTGDVPFSGGMFDQPMQSPAAIANNQPPQSGLTLASTSMPIAGSSTNLANQADAVFAQADNIAPPPAAPLLPLKPMEPVAANPRKGLSLVPFVIILILLVVVIGLTAFTLYQMTSGQPKVTFTANTTNSSNNTTEEEVEQEETEEEGNPAATEGTLFMLFTPELEEGETFDVTTLPAGSFEIAEEVGVYAVPVNFEIADPNATEAELLEEALKRLVTQTSGQEIEGLVLSTSLNGRDIEVEIAEAIDGSYVIDLTGDFILAGELEPLYIKSQLENTVEYLLGVKSYKLLLNGSESEYECLGDLSGTCEE